MNYLMTIVHRLRELASRLSLAIADDRLAAAYAQLVLTTGQATTLENVHDAWSAWRAFSDRSDHPMIVQFDQLASDVAEYDRPYRDLIRMVAAEVESDREKDGTLR